MIAALLPIAGKLLDKIIPDPQAKAEAQLKLAEMAQNGELAKMANETELYKTEQNNVTQRWTSDMSSDSWLSKNIRPMTLVFILLAYFLFALSSAFGLTVNESYVRLLGEWGQLIMLAYFGGRTVEKIFNRKGKDGSSES
jgi:hypothetical protein